MLGSGRPDNEPDGRMGLLGVGVRDEAIEAIEPIAEVGGVMSLSVLLYTHPRY
jgi:hypothetical protein